MKDKIAVAAPSLTEPVAKFLAAYNIPFSEKENYYKRFVQNVAKKDKQSYLKNMSPMGIAGATIGVAGASLYAKGNKAMAMGGAVGAGLGALLGALHTTVENNDIDEAKALISGSNVRSKLKEALLEEMGEIQYKHEQAKQRLQEQQIAATWAQSRSREKAASVFNRYINK